MPEQAPPIEPGKGKLIYDKERRTIVAQPCVWQPIETAPKSTWDGARVQGIYLLGFCPDEAIDPKGCMCAIWWEPNEKSGKGCWFGEGAMEVRPTHWMPLPEPPTV